MKLKNFSVILGDQKMRINNTRMEGETKIEQPIEYDPVTKIVVQHKSDTVKMVIDASRYPMIEYEIDKPILQS
jgi:hypothetical protein